MSKTQLQKTFQMFLNKNHERKAMSAPFKVENKIYATNAVALIWIDEDKLDFEFENPYPPLDVHAVIPKKTMSEPISLDEINKYVQAECDHCMNTGYINVSYEDRFGDKHTHDEHGNELNIDCPACRGLNTDRRLVMPDGEKVFNGFVVFKIGDFYLHYSSVYYLKRLAEDYNSDIRLVGQYYKNGSYLFEIGDINILISGIKMQPGLSIIDLAISVNSEN